MLSIDSLLLPMISLFVIINPFSTVPIFLAITPGDSVADRKRAARLACLVAGSLIALLAVTGQFIFSFLGITLPAFQIAGGILLFSIGFEMLRAPDAPTRLNPEEKALARDKNDIAITPLAVPLLCGPGAISTVIILQTQVDGLWQGGMLLLSVPIVYFACYLILSASASGGDRLNPIMLRILRRIMGLLFAAIAVQFIINGITNLPFVVIPVESGG